MMEAMVVEEVVAMVVEVGEVIAVEEEVVVET